MKRRDKGDFSVLDQGSGGKSIGWAAVLNPWGGEGILSEVKEKGRRKRVSE